MQHKTPTSEYGTFELAYDYFGAALFEGRLPPVYITLQRQRGARGYLSAERFRQRSSARQRTHELALNPDCFVGRTDEQILSTLVHEQCHVWQQEFGEPGRGRYHNRQWAEKMVSIGLMPSSTGEPGGKPTGDRVTHYILEGGRFQKACLEFLKTHRLVWESPGRTQKAAKTETRVKFSCPMPGHVLNGWGKPEAKYACYDCSREIGELILMLPSVTAEVVDVSDNHKETDR